MIFSNHIFSFKRLSLSLGIGSFSSLVQRIINSTIKKKSLLLLCFSSLLIFLFMNSCVSNSTEPEPNYEPGRRDYVWTADTIKAYYVYFNSIWGKTVNDVWMVSLVGSVLENTYRYDGTKWYREINAPIGNTVSLWGTESNVWISTHEGRIWKYRNNIFSSSPQFMYDGKAIDFFSMAGKNDNEVYACGGKFMPYNRDGLLYKYNGSSWQLDRVLKNYGNLYKVRYSDKNNRYYILSYIDNKDIADTTQLLEYDGITVKSILYQDIGENFTINNIDGFLYVSKGNKIYRYYDETLNAYLEVSNPNFRGQVWGRNKNDLLIQMQDGLMHFNGSDLKYILKFPTNTEYGSAALVLERDVFLHAFDNRTGYNIIYHGILK